MNRSDVRAVTPGLALNEGGGKIYIWRKGINWLMIGATALSATLAVVALLAVLGYVAVNGISALNVDFFTRLPTPVGVAGGGIANAIIGSLVVVGLATLFALPIGLGAGIYLSEFGHNRFGDLVRYLADVLSGVPSIVMGIFAYALIVARQGHFSALSASFALGVMMLPAITRTAEEMLRLVPDSLREGALALGLPRWRTTISVVLPTAAGGVITGVVLAVARVAGETAPLLFRLRQSLLECGHQSTHCHPAAYPFYLRHLPLRRLAGQGLGDGAGADGVGAGGQHACSSLWPAAADRMKTQTL